MYRKILGWGIGLFVLFSLFGCGDNIFKDLSQDNTMAAKIEEAKISLDEGDYSSAIDTLEELCGSVDAPTCDDDTKSLFASAYMGEAGLDVINLIDAAEDASKKQDTTAAFRMFADIIKPDNIGNLENAITLLDTGIDDKERTTGQELQLAVASASHMVASIINKTADDPNNPMNTRYDPTDVDNDLLNTVQDDLKIAARSASKVTDEVIDGNINLADKIEKFITDIEKSDTTDNTPETATAEDIDSKDLSGYIKNLNSP